MMKCNYQVLVSSIYIIPFLLSPLSGHNEETGTLNYANTSGNILEEPVSSYEYEDEQESPVTSTFKYKPPEVQLQFLHMQMTDFSVGTMVSPEFDNMVDLLGGIVLHSAVEESNLNMIESLIDVGADLNIEDYEGLTPLYKAILANNTEATKLLVSAGADVNFITKSGESLVHTSVVRWDTHVLRELLRLGAEVDVVNNDGLTALYKAAEQSNHQAINQLLSSRSNVNWLSTKGESLLQIAVSRGRLDIVKELTRIGSKIDTVDNEGRTPLYTALILGNPGLIKILIDNGANIDFVLTNGDSLLHKAVSDGRIEVIQKLIVLGARTDVVDNNGLTPMQLAIKTNQISALKSMIRNDVNINKRMENTGDFIIHFAVSNGKADAVQVLLDYGAELSVKNPQGYTPLVLAIFQDKTDIIDKLYNTSPVVNYKTGIDGNTPLHLAVIRKDLLAAEKLLKRGALVDALNGEGLTPLCKAAQKNDGNMVRMLLKHHANINFVNAIGETPLHKAVSNKSISSLVTLMELGADMNIVDNKNFTVLCKALELNSTNMVNALVAKGANVNVGCGDESPVYVAVRNSTLPLVKRLIQLGAKPDYEILVEKAVQYNNAQVVEHFAEKIKSGGYGKLLFAAASWGSGDAIIELLKKGTLVNTLDERGLSAIWEATMKSKPLAMKVLIDSGADLAQTVSYNRDGLQLDNWTLLHEAALNGDREAVEVLLDAGVDVDVRDSRSWSPLHYAAAKQNEEIVKELVKRGVNVMARTKLNELPVELVKRRTSYNPRIVEWLTTGRIY